MMIDNDVLAEIQSFTSRMSAKGYHVVGGLIKNEENSKTVNCFCTAPETGEQEHLQKLVRLLYYSVFKGESEEKRILPLGEN